MSELSIITSDTYSLKTLINKAINFKLFEENWSLADDYMACLIDCHMGKNLSRYRVAIGEIGNKPVAICFIKDTSVQFYVKKSYRLRGYATALLNSVASTKTYRKLLIGRLGGPASKAFLEKQQIIATA